MTRPIQAGDLVQVVRPMINGCGCKSCRVTPIHFFTVSAITITHSFCPECKRRFPEEVCAWVDGKHRVYALYRLKRIPPLDELEGEKTQESLKEKV